MNKLGFDKPCSTDQQHRVAVIGGGSKKGQDYILVLSKRDDVKLVATVFNKNVPGDVASICGRIIMEGDIDTLLKEEEFDVAVVSLPHFQHRRVTTILLKAGKRVIKEKPIALSVEVANNYHALISKEGVAPIFTTVQRSVHPVFLKAKEGLGKIGDIQSFTYHYTFALKEMTSGWRAEPEKSGGGVVMDMGYHIIDIVNFFFGPPEGVDSQFKYAFEEMRKRQLEDYASITFRYPAFTGQIILDRHADEKKEELKIVGSKGEIVITPGGFKIKMADESVEFKSPYNKLELISKMFDQCLNWSENGEGLTQAFERNLENIRIVEWIYLQHRHG